MRQRNSKEAYRQFAMYFQEDHSAAVTEKCFDALEAWYNSFDGQGDDTDRKRQANKSMLFAKLETVIGVHCAELKDERWESMDIKDQNAMIRTTAIEFLLLNVVADVCERGGLR